MSLQPSKPVSTGSLVASLFVLFLDNFSIYFVFPIFTPLILDGSFFPSTTPIEAKTFYLSLLIAAFPLAQFCGAPLFGTVADRIGRKSTFFITLLGECAGFTISAFAIATSSYWLLLFARLMTGFFAGNLTLCMAVVSDYASCAKTRKGIYGYVSALLGVSFLLALVVGGFLRQNPTNPVLPFYAAAALAFFNILIISICFTPHSLPQKQEFHPMKVGLFYLTFFLFATGFLPTLQFLSATLIEMFNASHLTIGFSFLGVGTIWFFGTILFTKKATHATLLLFSQALLLAFALSMPSLLLFDGLFSLAVLAAGITWATLTASISNKAPPNLRGRYLGFLQSTITLGATVGALLIGYFGQADIRHGVLYCIPILLLATAICKAAVHLSRKNAT